MDVVSRVRVSGPLAEFAAGFAFYLAGAGYRPLSAASQVRVIAVRMLPVITGKSRTGHPGVHLAA
jgi:hypothetical protein